MMKIHGYGGGAGHHPPQNAQARKASFRKRHRVGEVVRGRLHLMEKPGLAWVDFDGDALLTPVAPTAHGDSPLARGTALWFVIVELEPDIVLKPAPGGGGRGVGPFVDAVGRFWVQRAAFEAVWLAHAGKTPAAEATRSATLPSAVREAFATALHSAHAVDALLQALQDARFVYDPWILPEARDHERLDVAAGESVETALAFTLPELGACMVRILRHGDRAAVRGFVQHIPGGHGHSGFKGSDNALGRLLTATARRALGEELPAEAFALTHLGPLPPGPAGLLAGLFQATRGPTPSVGFSAKA